MGFLICDKCEGYYELSPGESPEDFSDRCECGGHLKYVEKLPGVKEKPKPDRESMRRISDFRKEKSAKSSVRGQKTTSGGIVENLTDFWNQCGTGGKIGIGVVGVCCLGILLVAFVGLLTGDASMSADQIKATAVQVTADDLYNDRGNLVGKPVKFTAEVLQPGDDTMRVCGIAIDKYGFNDAMDKDILLDGDFSKLTIYEHDEVYVYGVFKGQGSYTTVLGAERKIPMIKSAIVVPTGNKYK